MYTLVDADRLAELSLRSWNYSPCREYVYSNTTTGGKSVALHRLILGAQPGEQADHINGNKLDNRRANLRPATHAQNCWNSAKKARGQSRFKGVSPTPKLARTRKRWSAFIRRDGKNTYIGRYMTEEEAARAYDGAAREAFGEYARLNFPDEAAA